MGHLKMVQQGSLKLHSFLRPLLMLQSDKNTPYNAVKTKNSGYDAALLMIPGYQSEWSDQIHLTAA
jgi:hypothetical protein